MAYPEFPLILVSQCPLDQDRSPEDSAHHTASIIHKLYSRPSFFYELPCPFTSSDLQDFISFLRLKKIDFVFNFAEEVNGNSIGEIWISSLLEMLNIPFSGSSSDTLSLCRSKERLKALLNSYGLPTPKGHAFPLHKYLKKESLFTHPQILKPAHEDGSYGILPHSVISSFDHFKSTYKDLTSFKNDLFILETFLPGKELNVTILDQKCIAISEVDYTTFPKNTAPILSYPAKWDKDSPLYLCSPTICPSNSLSFSLEKQLLEISKNVLKHIPLRHYCRIDFRLSSSDIPYIIDINPNPCIEPGSGFMNALKTKELGYKKIIDVFLQV